MRLSFSKPKPRRVKIIKKREQEVEERIAEIEKIRCEEAIKKARQEGYDQRTKEEVKIIDQETAKRFFEDSEFKGMLDKRERN